MLRLMLGVLLGAGLVAGVHVATCEEDACIVWVCEVQGNRQC